ncbi:MAG: hypothetical protein IKS07_01210 [Lachnospiraceae bacterium]|nr:hypothetical protein [Lachnospiraceae bacterium]
MGFRDFWKNLFSRRPKNAPEEDENWEEIVYDREEVDFKNQEERSSYILSCLDQMAEASREMDELKGEYALVTTYLTDIEEIEALPAEDLEMVQEAARKLIGFDEEMGRFKERKTKLSDAEFEHMRRQESEIEAGIEKIRDAEHMAVLIKKDLRRLAGERNAYEFRRGELTDRMNNFRGMVLIFTTAFLCLMALLLLMQFGFGMNVLIGYFLATLGYALAITVAAIRFGDARRERRKVGVTLSGIISLQNRVKIRYVNNRKLLEYLYMKYHCESGGKLEHVWKIYQSEKEQRRQYTEAQAKTEFYKKERVKALASFRVHDPERWTSQVPALLDSREMVEIRHGLILRRQSLREQIEYNRKLAETAKEEITDVARTYPAYAQEILDMADRYQAEQNLS